ncbi:MAG: NRDE family protein [Desulfobacter sp.]|nr:MAG: NRDE family protein [Desulfobacter sp.]
MCLILFGIEISKDFPFILAANRDEFYNRPTLAMDFWPDNPEILAGKDLEGQGTWFGISTRGRFAALTNYRDLSQIKPQAPSRGEIIPSLLESSESIPSYLTELDKKADLYSGFNLLAGEGNTIFWYSNQQRCVTQVPKGVHGLSNHFLNTPWPKITRGKKGFKTIAQKRPLDHSALFELLSDRTRPRDNQLPDTGVGLEWEQRLSPLFISSPGYGTRSSTLMKISRTGKIWVTERTHSPDPKNEPDPKNRPGPEKKIFPKNGTDPDKKPISQDRVFTISQ